MKLQCQIVEPTKHPSANLAFVKAFKLCTEYSLLESKLICQEMVDRFKSSSGGTTTFEMEDMSKLNELKETLASHGIYVRITSGKEMNRDLRVSALVGDKHGVIEAINEHIDPRFDPDMYKEMLTMAMGKLTCEEIVEIYESATRLRVH